MSAGHTGHAALALAEVIESVFGSVAALRDEMVARHHIARDRDAELSESDITGLRDPLLALLAAEPAAIGMGVIAAPGLLPERPLLLEWWQSTSDRAADPTPAPGPVRLEVDLNADSIDFYDYAAAEWFAVPRTTGRRHVVGPYVDVHGTDRYLLTLTEPVIADGRFLGVAGADVPVARFETLVLRTLGEFPADLVVTNIEGRVVLSTSARWLIGELLSTPASDGVAPGVAERVRLIDLPWELNLFPV